MHDGRPDTLVDPPPQRDVSGNELNQAEPDLLGDEQEFPVLMQHDPSVLLIAGIAVRERPDVDVVGALDPGRRHLHITPPRDPAQLLAHDDRVPDVLQCLTAVGEIEGSIGEQPGRLAYVELVPGSARIPLRTRTEPPTPCPCLVGQQVDDVIGAVERLPPAPDVHNNIVRRDAGQRGCQVVGMWVWESRQLHNRSLGFSRAIGHGYAPTKVPGSYLRGVPSSTRPTVVFVTHHLPWPARSGGRVREAQLLQRLSARFDIEIVAVSKLPEFDRHHVEQATRHGVRARIFSAQAIDANHLGPLTRRHAAPAARDYLAHRFRQGTMVVHVEGHYLLGLVPKPIRPTVLLVEHNIESTLFEQRAAHCPTPAGRVDLLREGARTRKDELTAWRGVRIIAAVTDEDADAIRTAVPDADVRCLPNGADHLNTHAGTLDTAQRESARLLFVADLGYEPNLHAARLLLADIFPQVLHRCPDTTLAIVGSDPPNWLITAARHQPRVTVTGWVPDVAPWLDAAHVVVCPLTIGGGIKVKVLEALARGCAIVATPVALQGLRHLPFGSVVERSDTPALADACARLLTYPPEQALQRARAVQAARHLPSWDSAADILASIWSEIAATTASVRRE